MNHDADCCGGGPGGLECEGSKGEEREKAVPNFFFFFAQNVFFYRSVPHLKLVMSRQ